MNFLVLILAFVCHMDLVVYTFQNRSRVLHILRANSRRVKIHRKKLSINSTATSTPSSQAKMFEEIISTTTLPTTQTLSTPIQKLGQSEESTAITAQPPTSTTQSRVKMLYKLRMDAKKRNLRKTTTPLTITSTNTTTTTTTNPSKFRETMQPISPKMFLGMYARASTPLLRSIKQVFSISPKMVLSMRARATSPKNRGIKEVFCEKHLITKCHENMDSPTKSSMIQVDKRVFFFTILVMIYQK